MDRCPREKLENSSETILNSILFSLSGSTKNERSWKWKKLYNETSVVYKYSSNAETFKNTWINAGDYSLNSRRSWQHQLPKYCVDVYVQKLKYFKRWGGWGFHQYPRSSNPIFAIRSLRNAVLPNTPTWSLPQHTHWMRNHCKTCGILDLLVYSHIILRERKMMHMKCISGVKRSAPIGSSS